MRLLITIHVVVLIGVFLMALIMVDNKGMVLAIGAGAIFIAISGGLSAYFYYKRGKVYEKRGKSGPDH